MTDKDLLIVAGMHRSGTSAVMGLLDRLGFSTGNLSDHVPVAESNPYGHFELQPIVDFNERLLDVAGSHWAAPLHTGTTLAGLADGSIGDDARQLIEALGIGNGWAIKDPRFCLTLPFWLPVLSGFSVQILTPIRRPREVADSLARRNSFDPVFGQALWLRYHEILLESLVGIGTTVVDYGRLVGAPGDVVSELAAALNLDSSSTQLASAAESISTAASSGQAPESGAAAAPALGDLDPLEVQADVMWQWFTSLDPAKPAGLSTAPGRSAELNRYFAAADAVVREERIRRESFISAAEVVREAEADRDRARHHFVVATAARDRLQSEHQELAQALGESEGRERELSERALTAEAERDRAVEELQLFKESRAGRAINQYWGARNRLRGASEDSTAVPKPVVIEQPSDKTVTPTVSVIVPVHNSMAFTQRCLEALARHTSAHSFEVIVVDDASTDGTSQFLDSCSGVTRVAIETNVGFTLAVNQAALQASGEYLLLLNNDTEVAPGCIDELVATAQSGDDVGAVGAKLVFPDGTLQEAGSVIFEDGTGWNYGKGHAVDDWRYDFVREVDYCSAAALLVRRDAWVELGGFDERYAPAYYEDTDLCFGLRALGLRTIYQPRAVVMHHEGISHGTDLRFGLKATQTRNREIFVAKWASVLGDQPSADSVAQAVAWRGGPRVIVFDAEVPAPDQDSGSVRMHAMLIILRDLGYRVTFYPHNRFRREPYVDALQREGIEVGHGWDEWRDLVALYAEDTEAIIVSRPSVAAELVPIVTERAPNVPLLYDMVDFHGLRLERRSQVEDGVEPRHAAAITELELAMVRAADITIAVTDDEAAAIERIEPNASALVVPNIHSVRRSEASFEQRSGLLFVGSWRHPPNRDAVKWLMDDIMAQVWARHPEIHLHLVGSDMPDDVAEQSMANVTVHGWVEDLSPLFDRVRLTIAPLRFGAGMKGKIGDSLARGVPVVTTSVGAEGFGPVASHLAIGDTVDSLADHLVTLHSDRDRWKLMADEGCAALESALGFDAAAERIKAVMLAARQLT